ncbi:hypothetical protein [Mycobacterium hubeiense]|uniref:hypothetical protein n=1 Tax=Mycobacterium hubeiense TaxID=1867256 RepID=UPI000C7F65E5|nr:hypothetical protein [Mycobacterium sp. QGD 101]
MGKPLSPDPVPPLAPDTRFDIGPQQYPAIHRDTTIAIPMSDGVVLCADLFRPARHPATPVAEPLPVVVNFTSYNRLGNRYVALLARTAERAAQRITSSDCQRFGARDLLHTPAGGALDV